MKQIYDNDRFNDKVIRSVCEVLRGSEDCGDNDTAYMIDRSCLWENPGTIGKIKLILWKGINNNGYVDINNRYFGYLPVKNLKKAYQLLEDEEQEILELWKK